MLIDWPECVDVIQYIVFMLLLELTQIINE